MVRNLPCRALIDTPHKGADADRVMTEGAVTATIEDVMLAIRDLGDRMERRFEQVERRFEQVDRRFEQIERRFERSEENTMALRGEVAEIKGRIADMPTARDFGRLEGRVQEMSERLPTTIGYTPPRSVSGG